MAKQLNKQVKILSGKTILPTFEGMIQRIAHIALVVKDYDPAIDLTFDRFQYDMVPINGDSSPGTMAQYNHSPDFKPLVILVMNLFASSIEFALGLSRNELIRSSDLNENISFTSVGRSCRSI